MPNAVINFVCSLCLHAVVSSWFLVLNILGFLYDHIIMYFGGRVNIDYKKHIIVITGCDTGFGRLAAIRLSEMGFHVVALCMTDDGVQRLGDTVALSILGDVTKEDDIANLTRSVEEYAINYELKLWGVVCNAGIGNAGAVDWISSSTFRKVIEVNFFGVLNVTKALLPMLKKCKNGRIVNLSSVAGFLSAPMMASYDASKHAVEGYAKALRIEMKPWNIHVSNINPGFMRTPIVQNGPAMNEQEWNKVPDRLKEQYTPLKPPPSLDSILENPQLVVDDIIRALTDASPPMWYFPGNQSQYVFRHMTNCTSGFLDFLAFLIRFMNPIEPQPRQEVLKLMQN